jgi:hypothetical protein
MEKYVYVIDLFIKIFLINNTLAQAVNFIVHKSPSYKNTSYCEYYKKLIYLYTYLFIVHCMYSTDCCPHVGKILTTLPSPHESLNRPVLDNRPDGFGGLVVYWPLEPEFAGSNPAGAVGFFGHPENPQYAFLRRGSKIIFPMSQLCGM